jgi:hypothetical protein
MALIQGGSFPVRPFGQGKTLFIENFQSIGWRHASTDYPAACNHGNAPATCHEG